MKDAVVLSEAKLMVCKTCLTDSKDMTQEERQSKGLLANVVRQRGFKYKKDACVLSRAKLPLWGAQRPLYIFPRFGGE